MKNLFKTRIYTIIIIFSFNSLYADTIKFWTTEEQPARLAKQQEMAESFKSKTGHSVEVIPVTEKDLGKRATAAFAAGDLPDVIYHTLQYVLPWSEAGILDVEANNEIVDTLKRSTFQAGALNMANFNGMTAAVPVDGWTQMVVYRKDLFDQAGLAPPNSFANISAAVDSLHNPPSMYGLLQLQKLTKIL